MSVRDTIRARVLRGIALNRTPGLHFPGNFLDLSFDRVSRDGSSLSLQPGPWCTLASGEVDLAALALLADFGLAACIRANLRRATRLATVSLHLQFTGVPAVGRLRADGEFQGFVRDAAGRLGMSRVSVVGAKGQVCFGTGTFMALEPPKGMTLHPVPLRRRSSNEPPRLREEELSIGENRILKQADAALAKGGNFIDNFWGGAGVLKNGLHAGNRVGHAQGGILISMAAKHAATRLAGSWRLSGVTALYVSPGEGRTLRAASTVIHSGRLTAVINTYVTGKHGRRVLEVLTTHAASGAA